MEKIEFIDDRPKDIDHSSERLNIVKAYEKAQEVLSNPIDPRAFENYKDVDKDIALVNKLEAQFKEEFRTLDDPHKHFLMMGKVLEAICFEHIERSNWLGENAMTIQTSRYDDVVNGVDSIVEFDEGPGKASHIALAFDVTTSDHIGKKIKRIASEIDRGELTRVKYFQSEKIDIMGEKSNIPRVIIGADRKTVYGLASNWLHDDYKRLGIDPVQIKILKEMEVQLESYRTRAGKIGKDDISHIYERGLHIVQEILGSKKEMLTDKILTDIESDDVYREIIFRSKHIGDA